KSAPGDARLWFLTGILELRQSHEEKAVPAFKKALTLDPANSRYALAVAHALDRRGSKDAVAAYLHAADLDPKSPDARLARALPAGAPGRPVCPSSAGPARALVRFADRQPWQRARLRGPARIAVATQLRPCGPGWAAPVGCGDATGAVPARRVGRRGGAAVGGRGRDARRAGRARRRRGGARPRAIRRRRRPSRRPLVRPEQPR